MTIKKDVMLMRRIACILAICVTFSMLCGCGISKRHENEMQYYYEEGWRDGYNEGYDYGYKHGYWDGEEYGTDSILENIEDYID